MNKKIVLDDGKEIEYNELNWNQQAEIIDLFNVSTSKGLPLSLEMCGKLMIYTGISTLHDLNNKVYPVDEVYKIGAKLINEMLTPIIEKKNKDSDMGRSSKYDIRTDGLSHNKLLDK